MLLTPFCCNGKCEYHTYKVGPDSKHLMRVDKAPGQPVLAVEKLPKLVAHIQQTQAMLMPLPGVPYEHQQAALALKMGYKQIDRHAIQWNVDGLLINDHLCDVCYEVFKMVDV